MNNRGFTLIELTVVIIIIAILSVMVLPRFINFSSQTKMKVIEQAQVSVTAANDLLNLKSKMPSYSVVQVRVDLIDIDFDKGTTILCNQCLA